MEKLLEEGWLISLFRKCGKDMPLEKLLFKMIGMPSKSSRTIDVLLRPALALKGLDCKESGTTMLLQLNQLWDSSVMAFVSRILVPFVSVVAGIAQSLRKRSPQNVYTIRTIPQQKL